MATFIFLKISSPKDIFTLTLFFREKGGEGAGGGEEGGERGGEEKRGEDIDVSETINWLPPACAPIGPEIEPVTQN